MSYSKPGRRAERARERAERRAEYLAMQAEERPRRGARRARAGREPWRVYLPAHRATTARLEGIYPFIAEAGLGVDGVYIGFDRTSRGAFCFSPWALYRRRVVTNPNIVLAGIIGAAKSSLAKTLVYRSAAFGVRSYCPADVKGEMTAVARALGCEPVAMGPGMPARLNPLDAARSKAASPGTEAEWGAATATRNRRLLLLAALPEVLMRRPLAPTEHAALELALDACTGAAAGTSVDRLATPTLPQIHDALAAPADPAARDLGLTREQLLADSRDVTLTYRRLVRGDLAGMFDAPTNVQLDFDAPVTVMNMERIEADESILALIMTCASAWMESTLTGDDFSPRFMIYDEAWKLLKHISLIRRIQAQFKLARHWGLSNMVIMHRLSDLAAVGAQGSEAVALAEGLLADCSTRIIYQQESDQIERTQAKLGLTDVEAGLLSELRPGQGLWKIGQRSFLVDHVVAGAPRDKVPGRFVIPGGEWALVETDAAMQQPAPA